MYVVKLLSISSVPILPSYDGSTLILTNTLIAIFFVWLKFIICLYPPSSITVSLISVSYTHLDVYKRQSQYGAKAMAEAGKNYIDILKFYYTGVEVK